MDGGSKDVAASSKSSSDSAFDILCARGPSRDGGGDTIPRVPARDEAFAGLSRNDTPSREACFRKLSRDFFARRNIPDPAGGGPSREGGRDGMASISCMVGVLDVFDVRDDGRMSWTPSTRANGSSSRRLTSASGISPTGSPESECFVGDAGVVGRFFNLCFAGRPISGLARAASEGVRRVEETSALVRAVSAVVRRS